MVKALLIAVEDEIMDVAEAFLPYLVTGNGKTVAENLLPVIQEAARTGKLPTSLTKQRALPVLEGA